MKIFAFFCYLYDGFDARRFWRGLGKALLFPFKLIGKILLAILEVIGRIFLFIFEIIGEILGGL